MFQPVCVGADGPVPLSLREEAQTGWVGEVCG